MASKLKKASRRVGAPRPTQRTPKAPLQPPRNLTPDECKEIQEMVRICASYRWVAKQVHGNTALIPSGQMIASQFVAIADVLENTKNQFMAAKITECGYPVGTKAQVDIYTGQITPQ